MVRRLIAAFVLAAALAAVAACEAVDKQASLEYEAATKRWYAGDYPAAVSMYISMVKNHPYSPQADNALYWVGVTQFLYLGETERSLQTFRLLLKKYPGRDMAPPAQLYIAEIYELGYNDYVRAIEEYRKATLYSDKDVRERSLYSLGDKPLDAIKSFVNLLQGFAASSHLSRNCQTNTAPALSTEPETDAMRTSANLARSRARPLTVS